ncbi:hypothetical protein [Streptomyces sp. NPDC093600]|uniref:hypothetical protein n=1 Tax=Streptomyces sp. NPDC093600 TaxID=3366047 RepID=UPI00380AA037
MTQQQRVLAWAGAVVGALSAGGLLAFVVARDLDTADQVASVLGALAGLAGLGVSVYALKRAAPQSAAASVTVSGVRAVGIGGSVTGNISTGDHNSTAPEPSRRPARRAPQPPPADAGGAVRVTGERSVAAGGYVVGDVSTGDGRTGPEVH